MDRNRPWVAVEARCEVTKWISPTAGSIKGDVKRKYFPIRRTARWFLISFEPGVPPFPLILSPPLPLVMVTLSCSRLRKYDFHVIDSRRFRATLRTGTARQAGVGVSLISPVGAEETAGWLFALEVPPRRPRRLVRSFTICSLLRGQESGVLPALSGLGGAG